MTKIEKKITLLTHVSYDDQDKPYIGSVNNSVLKQDNLPKGRLTGFYGRNAAKKANACLWDYFDKLGKVYSRVDISIQSNGVALINQSLDDLNDIDVLNILLCKSNLTDLLEIWSKDKSIVKTMFLSDRTLFRKIANNPELINRLFEQKELQHIKAIIWPALDPNNQLSYITMISLREAYNLNTVIYNYDDDASEIKVKI